MKNIVEKRLLYQRHFKIKKIMFQTDKATKLLRLRVHAGHGLARKDIFGARLVKVWKP